MMLFNLPKPLRTAKASVTEPQAEKKGAIANTLETTLSDSPMQMISESIEASYALSPMQQGMLFHSLHEQQAGIDIEQMVCTLRENLEIVALMQAWERVTERHAMLRTRFRWQELDQPLQDVCQRVQLPLTQHDWRNLSDAEQQERHEAYLQRDRQRGFNLTRAPLMRLALFRLADAEYRLIWTFHHILLDGRSVTLLLKEVFAFYEAIGQGQALTLPNPHPYRDHIEWLQQQDLAQAKDFWQNLLKGFSTPTPLLPVQASSHLRDQADYGEEQICLSPALTTTLQAFAKQQDITPNTLVQGAWALLLSRYSGEEDVVFGAPRACRHAAPGRTEAMLGLLINTLPVRVKVPAETSLLPWLKALRSQHLDVRNYEHTPLVMVQTWSDLPPGVPLFESIVVFENYSLNTALQQGDSWQNRDFQLHERPGLPLVLMGYLDAELSLKISYDRSRFDQAAIVRLLGHLQMLLTGMIAQPEQLLADLTLVTETERHQLLVKWNDTAVPYTQNACLHHLFEAQVARNPDAIAVVYENQQLTYGEVNRQANQLAHRLQALGVGVGTFVGVYLNRGLEMIPSLLGILKAGGAYVPLEPSFPEARVQWILDSLNIHWVITQACYQPTFEGLQPHLPQLEHVICLDVATIDPSAAYASELPSPTRLHIWQPSHLHEQPQENLPQQNSPDDTAYVIFTSGSTGTPKGVVVQHQPVINLIEWVNRTFKVSASDRVLFMTSLCFDLSVYDIFGLLAAGASIRVVSNETVRNPAALLQILCHEPITFWDSAPPALQQLAPFFASIPATDRQSQLRLVFMSGDWIPVTLPDVVKAAFPEVKMISLGGATEATVWSNVYQIDHIDPKWTSIPYGKPIQNAQYYILDARLQPCPIGVTGELYIGGDCLASGYTDPVKTAERFISHPFYQEPQARLYRTGDLARFFPDGNIEFLGRIDHQVKIRGFRIELGEIEAVLAQNPAIRVSVVMAREDQPGEKRLVAYVVPRQQPAPTIGELRRCLKEKLPEYMVPSAFVMLKELPVTANGKLDRQALPAPELSFADDRQTLLAHTGTDAVASAFVAPRDELERQLTEIWQDILSVKPIGIHDNFFELGGHSLSAVRLWAQVEEQCNKGLPLSTLFQAPTISELAKALRQLEPAPVCPSLVVIQSGNQTSRKPPLFCIHVLGRGLEFYLPLVRYLDPERPVYGLAAQIAGDSIACDRVEALAAHYIQQMRTLQPQGPYLLVGVSFGGLVAYEMAQQLMEQGQEVALLGLFDTFPSIASQPILAVASVAKRWQKIRQSSLTDWLHMIGVQLRWRAHDLKGELWKLYCHTRIKICKRISLPLPDDVNDFNYEQENQRLANRYCIRNYSGRVTLFKAAEHTNIHISFADNELSWRSFAENGLEVHHIPGNHLGILRAPNVEILGKKLQECIARV